MSYFVALGYIFTILNPENNTIDFHSNENVKYVVWRRECDIENGINRLHGYVEFKKPVTSIDAKECVSDQACIESRKATRRATRDTLLEIAECGIAGPWEYGTWIIYPTHLSNAFTLQSLFNLVSSGINDFELADLYPELWERHGPVLKKFREATVQPRNFQTSLHILIGPPGIGKTYTIMKNSPDAYIKKPGKFYDGYNGTADIVIDHIDKSNVNDLFFLADSTPIRVEVHRSAILAAPKAIYVESTTEIEDWIPADNPHYIDKLRWRTTSITRFNWVTDRNGQRKITYTQEIVNGRSAKPAPPIPSFPDMDMFLQTQ